ncbi:MAG: hypothetical protein ACYC5G_04280 [Candidatus Doudnabacteria bacterium]
MNGLALLLIFFGIIFFIRWVIVTSIWKQKADKYDESQKQQTEIYVKNLDEILTEEERTRTARNIKLAFSFSKEILIMIAPVYFRARLQKSKMNIP